MPAVVLARMRDIRSSQSLSESSLAAFLRLATTFGLVTAGALAPPSESLESKDDIFLDEVLDAGLGFEKASTMDGCFTSTTRKNNQTKQG